MEGNSNNQIACSEAKDQNTIFNKEWVFFGR